MRAGEARGLGVPAHLGWLLWVPALARDAPCSSPDSVALLGARPTAWELAFHKHSELGGWEWGLPGGSRTSLGLFWSPKE